MKFLTNAVFAFLMISIHAVVAPAIAQDGGPKITGTLLGMLPDGTMEPLAGGTVTWIGTQISIGSDDNGRFELSTAGVTDERLVASFTGYRTDTIGWAGDTELTIELQSSANALGEVTVTSQLGAFISGLAVGKTEVINRAELSKAACCDLAGCFGTQASVQSHATNAVTNAQELRLLGLSGVYNQVLFEGLPMVQGLSYTYGISTYPGSIVENIHVSKGTTSVLQGFESITGQINVEGRRPASAERLYLNAYTNSFWEKHVNANLALDVGKRKHWHSLAALHTVQPASRTDGDGDGFMDLPLLTRYMVYNKWEYNTGRATGLTAQFGWRLVDERRIGGQLGYRIGADEGSSSTYGQSVRFTQPEVYMKSGYRFSANYAIVASASGFYHDQHSWFGNARYVADQLSGQFTVQHEWGWLAGNLLRYGASYRYQELNETVAFADPADVRTYAGDYLTRLRVPGVFIENTFESGDRKLALITGVRMDRHQRWGWYTTPRAMGKFTFNENHTLRASIGTGWKQVNLFSEQVNLLASSRDIVFTGGALKPERATTWGLSHTWGFWLGGTNVTLSGDFYQTRFSNQFFPDLDTDPTKAFIGNFEGTSRSNGVQLDALLQFSRQWELRAAYNYLDVYQLREGKKNVLPFNPKNRAMAALTYRTENDKWQFDANAHWYDRMRLPDTRSNPEPYRRDLHSTRYATFSTQATYKWKVVDFYLGCENIGGFRQANPIISSDNPFGQYFDLSSVWGPIRGREFYAGVRYKIAR